MHQHAWNARRGMPVLAGATSRRRRPLGSRRVAGTLGLMLVMVMTSLTGVTLGAGPAAAANVIVNGGFEEGPTESWLADQWSVDQSRPRTGLWSFSGGDRGPGTGDEIYQYVTVPASGTLRYYWYMDTNGGLLAPQSTWLDVVVLAGENSKVLRTHTNKSQRGSWRLESISLWAYAGTTVRLAFQAVTSASASPSVTTTFWVDDVSLDVVTPAWQPWDSLGAPPPGMMGNPDAASWGPGRLDVFARGNDGNLYQRAFSHGSGWAPWTSLGAPAGGVLSDPAAVSWGPGRLDVFVRGSGGLFQKTYANGAWQYGSWTFLGYAMQSVGSPDVASWEPGRLDVFLRGGNGNLYQKTYDGIWQEWSSLGAPLLGFPSDTGAVSWGPGRLDVFARGTAGNLVQKWFSNGWKPWASLGAPLLGIGLFNNPDAASWGPGRLDILVRGNDGNLWQKVYSSGWKAWFSLGAPPSAFASDPGAVSWGPGRLDIFVRGNDGNIWQRAYG